MMRRTKQINVSRALALAGLFHFLFRAARACFLPFLSLYLRRLGLTAAMTGMAACVLQLVFLLWSPASSLLAKRHDKRRAAVYGSVVSSAAVALLLLLLPPVGERPPSDACNVSVSVAPVTSSGDELRLASTKPPGRTTAVGTQAKVSVTTATTTKRLISTHNNSTLAPETSGGSLPNSSQEEANASTKVPPVRKRRSEEEEATSFDFLSSLKVMAPQQQLFFLVVLVVALWAMAAASLDWTVEDGLYEYLDLADSSDRHGSSGVWGLLGAACGVGGAGLLVSQLSCELGSRRSAAPFFLHAALSALVLPVAMYLPLHLDRKRERNNGLLKALQLVRSSPPALLCLATTLLMGAASSAVDDFMLWQMEDNGSGELQMGLALALALLSRAVFPLIAGRVSKLFTPPGRLLAVGAAALALQCLYYSFLWGAWSALPAQVLSSLSGGALWWAVGVQCEDVATPGTERSVGRVYGSLSLHLGGALGSLASGFAVQRFGLAWMFRGAAAVLTAWCVCLPLLQWKIPRQRRINYSRLLAADANASEGSESESEQERDWLDKAMDEERVPNNNQVQRINHYGQRINYHRK